MNLPFKNLVLHLCILYTVCIPGTCEAQKKASDHLELKLGITVSHMGAET